MLVLLGSFFLIIFGSFLIIVILSNAFSDIGQYNYRLFNIDGFNYLNYGILYLIFGLIVAWICIYGRIHHYNKELRWGITFIIIGLFVETIGGFLIVSGGVIILIDNFN